MDGLLLIDKPAGPTSHDIVSRLRRSSGERRIGHTGTLDPGATGLLPLVFGRATRLAAYISAGNKTYDATIRLGFATETDDALGKPLGDPASDVPAPAAIEAALGQFCGTFDQLPPSHSAKKVQGHRAYELARMARPVELKTAQVTVLALEGVEVHHDLVRVHVTATPGFYVRSLARDLGAALGCGGHLQSLRRERHGVFDVRDALALDEAERLGRGLSERLVAPADALPALPLVRLTAAGLTRAVHGNSLGPEHLEDRWIPATGASAQPVRVVAGDGRLVALAHIRGGTLHPVVVLG